MDSMKFWDLQPILVGFSGVLTNLLQPFAYSDSMIISGDRLWYGYSLKTGSRVSGRRLEDAILHPPSYSPSIITRAPLNVSRTLLYALSRPGSRLSERFATLPSTVDRSSYRRSYLSALGFPLGRTTDFSCCSLPKEGSSAHCRFSAHATNFGSSTTTLSPLFSRSSLNFLTTGLSIHSNKVSPSRKNVSLMQK